MTITRNNRIYGKALGLTIGGKDYWADLAKYELAPGDGDALTFADAAAGSSAWTLKGTAIQSTDTASFWAMVWESVGQTFDFVLAPHGNKTASETQPHFKGTVTISSRPPISSEAGDDKGSTFDFEWKVLGDVEKVTTGSTLGTGSLADSSDS